MALDIREEDVNGTHVIYVSGDVDLYSSPELRDSVQRGIPLAKSGLAIDLAGVKYIDSSGIATLVEGHRTADARKVEFKLQSLPESVLRVLQLSKLDSYFTIQ